MISKQEFEMQYCSNSGISLQEYKENFITLPCKCGDKNCLGWACVCDNKISIKNHIKLYC